MSDTLEKFLESRIISMIEDHELIKRAMQQQFVSLMQQNMGFSMRVGQKQELNVMENTKIEQLNNFGKIAPIDITKLKI